VAEGMMILPSGLHSCSDVRVDFSRLTSRDYILEYWRGEWFECFAPRLDISTLSLNVSDYTLSGGVVLDRIGWVLFALLCFSASIWLWSPGRGFLRKR